HALSVSNFDSFVIANERRQRNRFRRAEGRIPTRSMFTCRDLFAIVVDCLPRRNKANELFASVRVLTGDEPLILFARYFADQTPLLGQTTYPVSVYLPALAVVVFLLVGVILLVIGLGLARRQGITHRHHRCSPQKSLSTSSIISEVISVVRLPFPFPFAFAVEALPTSLSACCFNSF